MDIETSWLSKLQATVMKSLWFVWNHIYVTVLLSLFLTVWQWSYVSSTTHLFMIGITIWLFFIRKFDQTNNNGFSISVSYTVLSVWMLTSVCWEQISKTEQYSPTNIYRTPESIIIYYGSNSWESTDIRIYNMDAKKLTICKEIRYSLFKNRRSDRWYFCQDDKLSKRTTK